MAPRAEPMDDNLLRFLNPDELRIIEEFVRFSSRSETRGPAVENHLIMSLNFALTRQMRAS